MIQANIPANKAVFSSFKRKRPLVLKKSGGVFISKFGLMIFQLYKSVYKFVLYSSFIRFMCAKFFSSNSFNS